MMVKGMNEMLLVVFVLTLVVPLSVVTISVTVTMTRFGPAASVGLGVPKSSPDGVSLSSLGSPLGMSIATLGLHFSTVT